MKKIFFSLLTIVLLSHVPALAENILVCSNVDKPPKQWEDESGQYRGIWIDLMKAIDKEVPESLL